MRVASIQPAVGGATTIVLESATPLPHPAVGVLDGPPRIYFDFEGFWPASSIGVPPHEGIVRGVRIALNTADPPLTRIVIDLRQPARYRLDASAAGSGTLVIVVEGSAPAPRADINARSSTAGASAQRLASVLTQLEALIPVFKAIDTRAEMSTVSLQAASAQIESMAAALSGLHPTPALRPARDRLAQACVLAGQGLKARLESSASGNAALNWKAASAAAGALLLLDQAREDLGLAAPLLR